MLRNCAKYKGRKKKRTLNIHYLSTFFQLSTLPNELSLGVLQ